MTRSGCFWIASVYCRSRLVGKRLHAIRPDPVETSCSAVLILDDEQTEPAKDEGREEEKADEEEFHGLSLFLNIVRFSRILMERR